MKAPVNSRYVHSDGVTDIAIHFDEDENTDGKILTCGSDGDVRMWNSPDDKEPVLVFSSSDAGLGMCCYKNTVYVGTENNTAESFSLPTGKAEKVITKFTAAVNHVDVSKSGDLLVAGSGDTTIQLIKLKESSSPIKLSGHTAPVLSVLIDPLEEFFVSTGCDGTVSIWNLIGNNKQVKAWDDVFPSSNDILTSKTLCRPSWKPDGSMLAVPHRGEVIFYSRNSWTETQKFKVSDKKMLSVTQFSSCSKYFAAGSSDGTLFVWNATSLKLIYENADTRDHITGILFSKSSQDIFAVDIKGRLISVKNFLGSHETQNDDVDMDDELGDEVDKFVEQNGIEKDPFDDDMDDFLVEEVGGDANEISISKIKAMAGFIASEDQKEDIFVGVNKARKSAGLKTIIEDDAVSVSSLDKPDESPPLPIEMPFTVPQKPFQPSSSPENLQNRFMVWNDLGLIRQYEIEDDEVDTIDIEFHDVSFHNGIRLRNQNDYTIAALGKEAVIFASSNANSKIMCLHFSSWDNTKEWLTDLPKDEEATTVAIGTGWFVVGTSMNRLRIFTTGGIQRNMLDIGGQIIAISGHEDLLFITFHSGIGLYGNQCISYSILRIRSGTGLFPLIANEPLPLTPKSEISWVGFSDEGTPTVSDSTGTVRILNGRMWTTFLSMKESSRNDSDHYWVTSLSICNQQIRAIKCKGTMYPPTLPRPTVLLLDAKLPLCDMDTEKSQLEDLLFRSIMQNALAKKLDKKGVDVEQYREKADKDIKENLMKLFAISCKGDKDFRASEYVAMMPTTHSIQITIKYANRLRKMALTDRLTAIGRKKLAEEDDNVEEDDDDFENMRTGNVIYSSLYSNLTNVGGHSNNDSQSTPYMSSSFLANQSSSDIVFLEENPLLTRQRAEIQALCSSSPANYKNPFKRDSLGDSKTKSDNAVQGIVAADKTDLEGGKGLALIDAWKKPSHKPTMEFNPKHPKNKVAKKPSDKDKSDKTNKSKLDKSLTKKQPALFATMITGNKSLSEGSKQPKSPASINENSDSNSIIEDDDSEINGEIETNHVERKRKRSGDKLDVADNEAEKKSRISSKLSAFALKRNVNADEPDDDLGDV